MVLEIELAERLKPEPPTPEELECMRKLEPGDYEVYSEKLNMISLEAREIFTRIGISSMLHSGDMAVGIYTPEGDMVTAICGTYLHSVTAQIPIKFIMKYWKNNPTVGVREGDIFYCNEAVYGGIHNPDQIALMPIFFKGELIAWSAAAAHQPETGATEPGGMPVSAKSRHHEGMKLTPIKIGENYQVRDDLLEMMANMISRAPRMQVVDVRARATAADRVRIRVQELAASKGVDFLRGLFRKMLVHAEEGVRKRIEGWNDGTYRHVVFADTVGFDEGLLRICLTVRKQGDRLILDFSGTSPENEGSYHAFKHIVIAHSAVYLYGYPFHDFPISSGMFAPMDYIVPRGCILNANVDAAISCSPIICCTIWSALSVCFAKMMYDSTERPLVTAFVSANGEGYMAGGVNQWGVPVAEIRAFPLNTWGGGARSDMDGVDCHGFGFSPWGKAPDVEDVENEYPDLHLFQRVLPDTGGFGKYRGGAGITGAYVVHHTPWFAYMSISKESKIQVHSGVFGGYPGPTHPGIQITGSNVKQMLQSGDNAVPSSVYELITERAIQGDYKIEHNVRPTRVLLNGDVFVVNSAGGGGYGDVLERDPDMVMADIRNRHITDWVAQNIYLVAYNPQTLKVDFQETGRLRAQERADRLRRGKPFDEFEREWLQKKPKDEILKYYGSWPDAEKVREVMRI